ncbi:hypothetical protein SRHO_G00201520, partial [Serrasalmus rhombeus]
EKNVGFRAEAGIGRFLLEETTLEGFLNPSSVVTGRCPQDAAHRTLPTGRCPQDAAHRTLPSGRCWLDIFGWWTVLSPAATLRCLKTPCYACTANAYIYIYIYIYKYAHTHTHTHTHTHAHTHTHLLLRPYNLNRNVPISYCQLSHPLLLVYCCSLSCFC